MCLPLVTCALHVFVHHFPSYFVHICFHSLLFILVTILAPESEHDDGAGAIADSGDECRFFTVPALAFFPSMSALRVATSAVVTSAFFSAAFAVLPTSEILPHGYTTV